MYVEGGVYTHIVDSLHVYERHYDMIFEIINEGIVGYQEISVPTPSLIEACEIREILIDRAYENDVVGKWTEWLNET
jgi:thymidylate synthase